MPPPAAVVFDVNETLSDLEPLRDVFAELGAPRGLLDVWFASTLRDGFALTAAGAYAPFREVALAVLRGLLDDRAAQRILVRFTELDVHPDVPDGMRRLAGAGVRLATLSNGSADVAERLLQRAGLSDLVERRLSVDEVRRWKPAPEPYLHAARALGLAPDACTLVAVHPWDIDGAAKAGMQTAWLNRSEAHYPSVFTPPTHTMTSLEDLAERLG
jgi:2-haloacid dehalogenase